MKIKNYALLALLLVAVVTFVTYREASAVANGDGSCSAAEDTADECADFNGIGGIVIEFLGTQPATCNLPAGSTTNVPCTAYLYQYSGSATNQLNIAIPKAVMTKFTSTDKGIAGCSQLITDGSGDPTTGFGRNLLTHNICRVALGGSGGITPFTIKADPSTAGVDSWQVRQSTQSVGDALLGPALPAAPVAETAATLATPEGATVSYTNIGGQITITGGSGGVVPISNTKLCVWTQTTNPVPITPPTGWTCDTISFATDQCDIKTTGSDPCRFIGGSCILY